MSILFTNSFILPFLGFLLLPLIIHLVAKSRPRKYPFSSLFFIAKIVKKTQRLKRPTDWLMLLVRTVLSLLFVLLFLKPIWFSSDSSVSKGDTRNVLFVLDASASMGYSDQGQSRFGEAVSQIDEILSSLHMGDRANVILLKKNAEAIYPELGVNFHDLRSQLQTIVVSYEEENVSSCFSMVNEMFQNVSGQKDLYILSDFQAKTWGDVEWEIASDINVLKLKMGKEVSSNLAITGLSTTPARPLKGERVDITCDLANYSDQPRESDLYFSIGEQRKYQKVFLKPWEKKKVFHHTRIGEGGEMLIRANLGEDAFSQDNQRQLVVSIRDHIRVGVISDNEMHRAPWLRVLDSLDWVHRESISPEEIASGSWNECDSILVLAPELEENVVLGLKAHLDSGKLLLWAPEGSLSAYSVGILTGQSNLKSDKNTIWDFYEIKDTQGLVLNRRDAPLFSIFNNGEYGDPGQGAFSACTHIPQELFLKERMISYANGVPALLSKRDKGQFYLWNIPLQREYGNWEGRTEFFTIVAEVLYSARLMGEEKARAVLPGGPAVLASPEGMNVNDIKIVSERGKIISVALRETFGGRELISESIKQPGYYRWESRGIPLGSFVVNFPENESDLRALSSEEMREMRGVKVANAENAVKLKNGAPIWQWILIAAVVFLMLEALLAYLVDSSGDKQPKVSMGGGS